MAAIELGYEAREQFVAFHCRKHRWGAMVAHRRAGKTVACIMDLVDSALRCDKVDGRFAYVAPTYTQAKDVAWAYLKRFTGAIPGVEHRESDLSVILPHNKARIRLYGAETYDRMRGLYFDGVILDEYGDMDPRAWSEVIRPALSDRKGWAVFIGTPKGRNHFCEVWENADANWFRAMLRASETGILDADELADARKSMTPNQFEQEYECSFQAAIMGAYYGQEIQAAEAAERITKVGWEPKIPVHTAWDLGIGDSTAIWFFQMVGSEIRLIDYLESNGVGLGWYVNQLKERPYTYGDHILPHDAEVRELTSGASRKETLQGLGVQPRILGKIGVDDGINAARMLLPRCWFDEAKCKQGLAALRQYRREWDERRKVFNNRPLHDWCSHAADAFRYLATGLPEEASGWSKPLRYGASGIV